MIITPGGNIGIGTTAPGAKLSVSGSTVIGNNLGASRAAKARLDVIGTVSGSTILGSNGVTTKVVAGACSDANANAADGTLCIDSADGANGRIYFRFGGAWHYAAGTGGFQVPNLVDPETGKNETEGMNIGDLVVGKINQQLGDGALHGLWTKFDLPAEITKTLAEHPDLFTSVVTPVPGQPVTPEDLKDLVLQGSLVVLGSATFKGDVSVEGTLTLSTQQGGTVTVSRGQDRSTVTFIKPFAVAPTVTATPNGRVGAEWWVEEVKPESFTVRLSAVAEQDVPFSWLAIPVKAPEGTPDPSTSTGAALIDAFVEAASGTGSSASSSGSLIPFPVDAKGVPVSSDPVWNNCIRNIPTFGPDGRPESCSSYHDGYVWTHPDLGITFTWNTHTDVPLLILPDGYETVVSALPSPPPDDPSSDQESGQAEAEAGNGTTPLEGDSGGVVTEASEPPSVPPTEAAGEGTDGAADPMTGTETVSSPAGADGEGL